MSKGKSEKAQGTKKRILNAALALFLREGYDAATMRLIAAKAGCSLGSAYYYFPTKEHIIQAFYERNFEIFISEAETILAQETDLRSLIRSITRAQIVSALPYHALSRILFKSAAEPGHLLSPFSDTSGPLRAKSIKIYRRVLEVSGHAVDEKLTASLSVGLWFFHMAIIVFWVHDQSEEHRRTFEFIDRSLDLVVPLVNMGQSPLLRHYLETLLALITDFAPFTLYPQLEEEARHPVGLASTSN